MKKEQAFSILYPQYEGTEYRQLSPTTAHDLGLDTISRCLTDNAKEQTMFMNVITNMTADTRVAAYRQKVFADILALPEFRKRMLELFDQVEFIRNFGIRHKNMEEKMGLYHLLNRLDDIDGYIKCVEAMRDCLSDANISSEGLIGFRKYLDTLYDEASFAEMKQDIADLKKKSSKVQSVTLGINVNQRFEAVSMGLISVNDKPFKKSGIVGTFADAVAAKNKIQEGTEWDGSMHYHLVDSDKAGLAEHIESFSNSYAGPQTAQQAIASSTIVNTPEGDGTSSSTFYLENVLNKMLETLIKKLRDTLTKYANIAVVNISQIIPEFIYYIRFAEFIEKHMAGGFPFCEAHISDSETKTMQAKGFYNLKLAIKTTDSAGIVPNDLDFDPEHTIYILTGANRGGKTTVTQAVGLLFVLAQGGIFVPAKEFAYRPVDCIYTHFPADEDKTMELGRLGEECVRFKDIYKDCTDKSLLLLNESFSTTSFEEGYYIAKDSVRALLKKNVRTIYNTHMHKLAADADEMNRESDTCCVSSLIVKSDNGKRSFKVEVAPADGISYARDIAEKYGVTYEILTGM